MYEMNVRADTFKTVCSILWTCGSVNTSADMQQRLYKALKTGTDLETVAAAFVEAAVPWETKGQYEEQATYIVENQHAVQFKTPGGVTIRISRSKDYEEQFLVYVWFGRDSKYLALQMLTSIFMWEPHTLVAPFFEEANPEEESTSQAWLVPVFEVMARAAADMADDHNSRLKPKPTMITRRVLA